MKLSEMINDLQQSDNNEQTYCVDYLVNNCPEVIKALVMTTSAEAANGVISGMSLILHCIRKYGMPDDLEDTTKSTLGAD